MLMRIYRVLGRLCTGFALLAACPAFASPCDAPQPLASIDIPGFYDDPTGYARGIAPLHAYIDRINKAADAGDEACLVDLLDTWASADALMAPINGYQGYYERAWAVTDFSLALMRFKDVERRDTPALKTIKAWLIRLAASTRDAEAINRLHNNLVYWAGLDLVSVGVLTHRADLVDAGLARAREGIRDIGPHGELQRELKRGERALHYHNFALIPLVFTAELANTQGIDLYAENDRAIQRLANLVIRAVQDPGSFDAYSSTPQKLFPWTFASDLAWMEPYYARFHDARVLPLMETRRPFENPRLGGNVTAAWAENPLIKASLIELSNFGNTFD
ncbi:MAG: alginate lyase family protein [Burkholderiales bacterium]|nr:alginate lyase family protein [Burkholderiales bacterium]